MKITHTVESGPSTAARWLTRLTRSTVRPALRLGCHAAGLPWPFGAIETVARLARKPFSLPRTTIQLSRATATLFNAPEMMTTDRVVLYMHGGGFLACGPNTHAGMIERLSSYAHAPVLAVDYRMIPKHSVGQAVGDCLEAYLWLRESHEPHQIALAGDSAGGYLALTIANKLAWLTGETPGALCLISPFLQFDPTDKKKHPNVRCDAMFGPEAFDALLSLAKKANRGAGIYEPLDELQRDLPPTLIHVSGHEVLLHDARLAAARLSGLGVPVEVHVWPGQIHVFQVAAGLLPEATQSLRQIGQYIRENVGNKTPTAESLVMT